MEFLVTDHKDKFRKGKIVKKGNMENMGNWRSRWERKRDLDRSDVYEQKNVTSKMSLTKYDKNKIKTIFTGK